MSKEREAASEAPEGERSAARRASEERSGGIRIIKAAPTFLLPCLPLLTP